METVTLPATLSTGEAGTAFWLRTRVAIPDSAPERLWFLTDKMGMALELYVDGAYAGCRGLQPPGLRLGGNPLRGHTPAGPYFLLQFIPKSSEKENLFFALTLLCLSFYLADLGVVVWPFKAAWVRGVALARELDQAASSASLSAEASATSRPRAGP